MHRQYIWPPLRTRGMADRGALKRVPGLRLAPPGTPLAPRPRGYIMPWPLESTSTMGMVGMCCLALRSAVTEISVTSCSITVPAAE